MERYDARAIESKWQRIWAEEGTWEVANPGQPGFEPDRPKAYVLEMLPYPSGEPHVGHLKTYAVGYTVYWQLLLGVILVVLVLSLPTGIVGTAERLWARWRAAK